MRDRRVFLVGYYGIGNLGDEAILHCLVSALDGSGATVANFATRSSMYRDDPRAVQLRGRQWHRYLGAVLRCDAVLLGGGGILKDEGLSGPVELLFTTALARILGKRVSLLAAGVGPFYTAIGRRLVAWTARLASTRLVRDDESAVALAELGIQDVCVVPDAIFAAPPETPISAPRERSQRVRIGINVRPMDLRRPAAVGQRDLVRRIAAAVNALESDTTAVLLPMSPTEDGPQLGLLQAQLRLEIETSPEELSWPSLLSAMRELDAVIVMRFHALAAAAISSVPAVALPYEPKVAALARQLGVPTVDPRDANLVDALRVAVQGQLENPRVVDFELLGSLHENANAALARAVNG